MSIKNISFQLKHSMGVVSFDTNNGSFSSTFVLIGDTVTFGSGIDDPRLTEAEANAVMDAVQFKLETQEA